MLFFKPKHKDDDILPPPPPFPDLESEEEEIGKPELFDEVVEPEETKTSPELEEFGDLVKELEKEKKAGKKTKISRIPEIEEDFKLYEHVHNELELPETLEEFGRKGLEQEFKPKEILEAEDEIKSAIEKIKGRGKSSLLKRLFAKKAKKEPEEQTQELPEMDNVSAIQGNIRKTKEALMKFDLDAAKRDYIEVMRIYNQMSPSQKSVFYRDIKELYFERKSAEGLKV